MSCFNEINAFVAVRYVCSIKDFGKDELMHHQCGRLLLLQPQAPTWPSRARWTFSRSTLRDCIETNAISPAMVTQAFAPLVLQSSAPHVVYVSSVLGSITRRGESDSSGYGETYKAYRTSKAAYNAWEYEGRIKLLLRAQGI
jgi:NAD(P)-dependent dehydrogenase (short-subunit alcohol dehydrogenase family)